VRQQDAIEPKSAQARHSMVLCDFGARAFPLSNSHFSDWTISFAGSAHRQLVSETRNKLLIGLDAAEGRSDISNDDKHDPADDTELLALVARSQLLRDPHYIGFLLARAREYEVHRRLSAGDPGGMAALAFAPLLDSAQAAIGDAAMGLLIAQHRTEANIAAMTLDHADLPADVAHKLVWRVAAALAILMPAAEQALRLLAEQFLLQHDESLTRPAQAQLLAQQILQARMAGQGDDGTHGYGYGYAVTCAMIALQSGLCYDDIVHMAAEFSDGRLVRVLKAMACDVQNAASIVETMTGASEQFSLIAYDSLDSVRCRNLVQTWADSGPMEPIKAQMQSAEPWAGNWPS
jgi:hypothetical protein